MTDTTDLEHARECRDRLADSVRLFTGCRDREVRHLEGTQGALDEATKRHRLACENVARLEKGGTT